MGGDEIHVRRIHNFGNHGQADLVAFGRPFVANPDLPERLRTGAALAPHDRNTLFGGGERGLTDYPTLAQAAA